MTMLFTSTKAIKPSNRNFGARITVPKPTRFYSDSDAAWAAELFDTQAKARNNAEGNHLERLCEESATVSAACSGLSFA